MLTGRNQENLEKVASECTGNNRKPITIIANLDKENEVENKISLYYARDRLMKLRLRERYSEGLKNYLLISNFRGDNMLRMPDSIVGNNGKSNTELQCYLL